MPYVLKLPSLYPSTGSGQALTRSQRQAWVLALKSLYPSQLVGAHHSLSLLCQGRSLLVQTTYVTDFFIKLLILSRSQPIAYQVWFDVPLCNTRAAWRGEILSTMPTISSAISRLLHWLMGRSERLGASHATATIWQTCWAVIRAGAPGRGASVRRSWMLTSSRLAAANPNHRLRHRLDVLMFTPNWRAI